MNNADADADGARPAGLQSKANAAYIQTTAICRRCVSGNSDSVGGMLIDGYAYAALVRRASVTMLPKEPEEYNIFRRGVK